MPSFKLRTLFASDSHSARAIQSLCAAFGAPACVVDNFDRPLMGAVSDLPPSHVRLPIHLNDDDVGYVLADPAAAHSIVDLLTHLARNLEGARILVVGTYRDLDVDRTHPLAGTLAELRRGGAFERLLLRGLTAGALVAGGVAAAGALLAAVFLPAQPAAPAQPEKPAHGTRQPSRTAGTAA